MKYEIIMPEFAEGAEEINLRQWMVAVGDTVKKVTTLPKPPPIKFPSMWKLQPMEKSPQFLPQKATAFWSVKSSAK